VGFAGAYVGGPNNVAGAFVAALIGVELGKLVSKETKVDIIVTPAVTLISGMAVAMLVGDEFAARSDGRGGGRLRREYDWLRGELVPRKQIKRPIIPGVWHIYATASEYNEKSAHLDSADYSQRDCGLTVGGGVPHGEHSNRCGHGHLRAGGAIRNDNGHGRDPRGIFANRAGSLYPSCRDMSCNFGIYAQKTMD